MSEKHNGGPAFPSSNTPDHGFYAEGMTMRDYFAAKAVQGAFSPPIAAMAGEKEYIARHAYAMADAMLAERAK